MHLAFAWSHATEKPMWDESRIKDMLEYQWLNRNSLQQQIFVTAIEGIKAGLGLGMRLTNVQQPVANK